MMNKLPPQNLEAEKIILAGILIDPEQGREALDAVRASDFYNGNHKLIFNAALDLAARKERIDLVTIKSRLAETGDLEKIGGQGYLADLTDYITVSVLPACQEVREKANRRDFITKTARNMAAAYDITSDFSKILDKAQADILGIDNSQVDSSQDMATWAIQSVNRYGHKHEHTGIKTGFSVLDRYTGGLLGSALMIIAARPGIGKTAMMLSMARNMARAGHHVGLFSIEMDGQQLMDRLFSMETGINSVRLSTRARITREEADRITQAAESIAEWPILIDDTGGLSISELKRRCRKMKKEGVEIIFIDQLSKITGGQGRSEYERKTDIVNQVSGLVKELRLPVVLLAQINRNIEGRADKAPTLADLKSTGSLEEDADMILLGHREYVYSQDPADKYRATWELAKHRAGPTRKIEMAWNPKLTLFEDLRN
jgi:replicative DNA helicase